MRRGRRARPRRCSRWRPSSRRRGRYAAALVSAEEGAPFGADPGAAEDSILAAFRTAISAQLPRSFNQGRGPRRRRGIGSPLRWRRRPWRARARSSLFIDEIDALRDDALPLGAAPARRQAAGGPRPSRDRARARRPGDRRRGPRDDIDYALDLGLITRDEAKNLVIANPIYREVIPRELASVTADVSKRVSVLRL